MTQVPDQFEAPSEPRKGTRVTPRARQWLLGLFTVWVIVAVLTLLGMIIGLFTNDWRLSEAGAVAGVIVMGLIFYTLKKLRL